MADDHERRRDELAWAAVHRGVESGSWRRIDRAVATSLPAARERSLLDPPWKVYLFPTNNRSVTRAVWPSGSATCWATPSTSAAVKR